MIGLQKLVGRSYRSLWLFSALGISKAQLAQDLQTGVSETGETVIIQPGKPNAPKYQVGQAIRFTSIYPTPDALINEHLSAEALWTQVGTITAKLPDRQNLYRIENSGHLLGYVNDGDIAELWRPQTKKSFLIGVDEGIVLRADQPSLSAPIYGIYPKYSLLLRCILYCRWVCFIGGTDTTGARIYLPIGPNDGNAQNTWGSFTS